jgi:hypothetical protein
MDGVVVAVCDGGFVRAFSYEGKDLWTYRTEGKFAPFIARGPDGITWVAPEEPGGPRSLIALNRIGRKISELRFDTPFTAPPKIGLDGRIFVPFGDRVAVYAFRGQKLGEAANEGPSYNGFEPMRPPAYPGITLSMTRAESRRPGSEWALDITDAAALPVYNGAGLVIVGGTNWLLAAYRVEDRPLPKPSPPETYGLAKRIPVSEWTTLEDIAATLDAGTVGISERSFASFLMETAQITTTLKLRAKTIEERAEALTLLGRLGSPEYVPFLTNIFNQDTNSLIKASAAEAIGTIGIDRNGNAAKALANVVLPVFPLSNSLVINAAVEAAGKLSIINGPSVYAQTIAILGAYSVQQNFPGIQKQAANWISRILSP